MADIETFFIAFTSYNTRTTFQIDIPVKEFEDAVFYSVERYVGHEWNKSNLCHLFFEEIRRSEHVERFVIAGGGVTCENITYLDADNKTVENDAGIHTFEQFLEMQRKETEETEELTFINLNHISDLNRGDEIRHKGQSKSRYIVTGNYGGRVTAVSSVDVTNEIEWEVLK